MEINDETTILRDKVLFLKERISTMKENIVCASHARQMPEEFNAEVAGTQAISCCNQLLGWLAEIGRMWKSRAARLKANGEKDNVRYFLFNPEGRCHEVSAIEAAEASGKTFREFMRSEAEALEAQRRTVTEDFINERDEDWTEFFDDAGNISSSQIDGMMLEIRPNDPEGD